MATAFPSVLEDFVCSLCLDYFKHPYTVLPCNHVYCKTCLDQLRDRSIDSCPQCRSHMTGFCPDDFMAHRMRSTEVECRMCFVKVSASEVSDHMAQCSVTSVDFLDVEGIESGTTQERMYKCPFCGRGNIRMFGLLRHCVQSHKNDKRKVVCPICASMPWGDPALKSSNLIKHLQLRHRFDYHAFKELWEMDEDTALERAVHESLTLSCDQATISDSINGRLGDRSDTATHENIKGRQPEHASVDKGVHTLVKSVFTGEPDTGNDERRIPSPDGESNSDTHTDPGEPQGEGFENSDQTLSGVADKKRFIDTDNSHGGTFDRELQSSNQDDQSNFLELSYQGLEAADMNTLINPREAQFESSSDQTLRQVLPVDNDKNPGGTIDKESACECRENNSSLVEYDDYERNSDTEEIFYDCLDNPYDDDKISGSTNLLLTESLNECHQHSTLGRECKADTRSTNEMHDFKYCNTHEKASHRITDELFLIQRNIICDSDSIHRASPNNELNINSYPPLETCLHTGENVSDPVSDTVAIKTDNNKTETERRGNTDNIVNNTTRTKDKTNVHANQQKLELNHLGNLSDRLSHRQDDVDDSTNNTEERESSNRHLHHTVNLQIGHSNNSENNSRLHAMQTESLPYSHTLTNYDNTNMDSTVIEYPCDQDQISTVEASELEMIGDDTQKFVDTLKPDIVGEGDDENGSTNTFTTHNTHNQQSSTIRLLEPATDRCDTQETHHLNSVHASQKLSREHGDHDGDFTHSTQRESRVESLERTTPRTHIESHMGRADSNTSQEEIYKCPFCGRDDIKMFGLLDHCVQHHDNDTRKVVCPICASMPWGDPALKSSNLIKHLQLRHRFDYHAFKELWEMDEDTALERAVEESLR